MSIPVMGRIAAGTPISAIQNRSHSITLSQRLPQPGRALRPRGARQFDGRGRHPRRRSRGDPPAGQRQYGRHHRGPHRRGGSDPRSASAVAAPRSRSRPPTRPTRRACSGPTGSRSRASSSVWFAGTEVLGVASSGGSMRVVGWKSLLGHGARRGLRRARLRRWSGRVGCGRAIGARAATRADRARLRVLVERAVVMVVAPRAMSASRSRTRRGVAGRRGLQARDDDVGAGGNPPRRPRIPARRRRGGRPRRLDDAAFRIAAHALLSRRQRLRRPRPSPSARSHCSTTKSDGLPTRASRPAALRIAAPCPSRSM